MPKLGTIALVLATAWPALAAPEKPKTLIVDLRRIIDECDEGREFIGALQKRNIEKKQEIEKQVRKLQEQQSALMKVELMNRDEQWYAEVRKALEAQARLEVEKQYFLAQNNDRMVRQVNELIIGAQQEARRIMTERGAEVVLVSRMGPVTLNTEQDTKDEIIFRRVLCSNADLDITNDVIKRMNEWFQKNKNRRNTVPERPKDEGKGEKGSKGEKGDASK